MISAHSSADVCSRCTHLRKVSASSVAQIRARLTQAKSKVEQIDTTTRVSETGEELLDIVDTYSWVD